MEDRSNPGHYYTSARFVTHGSVLVCFLTFNRVTEWGFFILFNFYCEGSTPASCTCRCDDEANPNPACSIICSTYSSFSSGNPGLPVGTGILFSALRLHLIQIRIRQHQDLELRRVWSILRTGSGWGGVNEGCDMFMDPVYPTRLFLIVCWPIGVFFPSGGGRDQRRIKDGSKTDQRRQLPVLRSDGRGLTSVAGLWGWIIALPRGCCQCLQTLRIRRTGPPHTPTPPRTHPGHGGDPEEAAQRRVRPQEQSAPRRLRLRVRWAGGSLRPPAARMLRDGLGLVAVLGWGGGVLLKQTRAVPCNLWINLRLGGRLRHSHPE